MNKALLSTIVFLSFALLTRGQNQPAAMTVKGIVIDSAKNQPLSYATIALVDAVTNITIKSTFSKDDGSFSINGPAIKPYKLAVVNVGYGNKVINISNPKATTDLGKLYLSPSLNQLKEVSVVTVKPLMKREVDRMSYDVQADPDSKVITVLDMMRKVPLLSVDGNDNIKLQGNTNYKILINGKESALIARNPADVFKSMPASNIQKIEVITTPPAKYDAEGIAGIINIITKKNMEQGYNGSVNARYSTIWGSGGNLNLTVKQGRFGLAGYAGYYTQGRLNNAYSSINESRNSLNENDPAFASSYLTQQGNTARKGNNAYGSTELTYEADSLNLFTGTVEFYRVKNFVDRDLISNLISSDVTGNNSYQSYNTNNNGYRGLSAGLNYQLGFKRNKEQLLTASYKFNASKNDQFNNSKFIERVNYNFPNYQQFNKSGSNEHTLQLDYVQPLKKLNLEGGAKAIFRNNFSDSRNETFDKATNQYILIPEQTDNFDYQQNVYSLYNSYQYKFNDKWIAKGGLRFEYTTVNANNAINQRYSNLVPSVSVQRSFKSSSVNLGYSDRIQRPGIWQLNPFINTQNPNMIYVGNPDLRPVVSHNVELTYSTFKKGSINVGLNYKFANNTVENITIIDPLTAVSTSTYQNVGANKRLGMDLNVNYPVTSKLNVNVNSQLVHVWLKGYVNGQFFNAKGYQGHTFAGATYNFDKGYRAGLNFDYDSRYVMLQGRDNYWVGYSASISKEFLNKKATIALYANTPFQKFRKIDNTIRTPTSYQFTVFENNARNFNVSFNYKFGKLSGELKKNQRGIKNDDVSGGSRN
ncbi:TonB-dependent receptor [Mucilaginibacter sp. Bleaf8]|uniref:outer membrane beta-barrel family protein n=1 Tax=Mucilaginibacter sp. Bleaf8 TaxID=2834430 RepID=UPI001BCE4321|nr:outer membrane beta-barrel family protein [Mucilaginibacter sp. Bleaf8]MBS7566758.1 TonB-dependent receptor [Mucilaginibacter sp. Bleaf8]